LLKSRWPFFLNIYLNNLSNRLQAGEYILNSSFSPKEITDKIISGEVINRERTIKIIEGWNLRQIAEYLTEKGFAGNEFLELAEHPEKYQTDFSFLGDKPDDKSLEGYLFPDTYRVFADASADDIIRKVLSNFSSKLDEQSRADIASSGKTIYEIITMASLVEKEATIRTDDNQDARLIAGIFWSRIDNRQALQSCATLAYILGEDKAQYSFEDTQIKSPYNTYLNLGLPPGPIGNPGLEAIKAALYPLESEYNYFLSPLGSESTIFSKTYEEHLANKAKYLK
jgi:UPF0755 protein